MMQWLCRLQLQVKILLNVYILNSRINLGVKNTLSAVIAAGQQH